uniref:Uncharacterized protein n=1 Tax=Tetranychus urticae TaxID=32264 RepID=T1JSK4_TETUR
MNGVIKISWKPFLVRSPLWMKEKRDGD